MIHMEEYLDTKSDTSVNKRNIKKKRDKSNIAKCSEATQFKQDGFAAFLDYHLRLANAVCNRRSGYYPSTYFYADMNAGPGHNDSVDIPGSPVIFLDAVKQVSTTKNYNMKHETYFIEQNTEYTDRLKTTINMLNSNSAIINGNHKEELIPICNKLKVKTLGLIYHDPNGEISFDTLKKVFFNKRGYTHTIDLLIRVSATTLKRDRTRHPKLKDKHKSLSEYIKEINKTTWLIKKPEENDKFQWTFIFGTNYANMNAYKKKGFFRLETEEGQEILKKLDFTKKELDEMNKNISEDELSGTEN